MQTTLAIDTAIGTTSLALQHGGQIYQHDGDAQNQQAGQLIPSIETLLNQADIWYDKLDRMAITLGPGSFTGIRVGLATAQTIRAALNTPIIGFSTLEALCWDIAGSCEADTHILASLRAGRGHAYSQHFTVTKGSVIPMSEPIMVTTNILQEDCETAQRVIGNVPELMEAKLIEPLEPRALQLLHALRHEASPGHAIAPLYIQPPDAKLPQSLI